MEKKFFCFVLALSFSLIPVSYAKTSHSHSGHSCSQCRNHNHHHNYNNYHSSSSSNNVYLVKTDSTTSEQKFPDCNDCHMITETITKYYSDGSKRIYLNSKIYDSKNAVIASDCSSVEHIVYKNNHYFAICKNRGGCSLINEKGENITKRSYSMINKIADNRLLVKFDKKYGIIDLNEKTIVPIKYQRFQKIGEKTFITKLNGYWGILDYNNKVLVKNDCEKIRPLYDTILIKRYGKFGLANYDGKILYDVKYDKIKKFGEYIVIKKNDTYQLLDSEGQKISEDEYKKLKLKRNTLYGYTKDKRIVKPVE